MVPTGVFTHPYRELATGLLTLCLALSFPMAAVAQPPEAPAEQDESAKQAPCCGEPSAPNAEQSQEATISTKVCPQYPYMYHGSYVSYYALVHPGCTDSVAYDGPEQDPADCPNDIRCPTVSFIRNEQGLRRHSTDSRLEVNGIAAPTREDILPIAAEIDTTVKYIQFPANGSGTGGQMVRAKVWFFKVEPKNQPAIFAGVGYQVEEGAVHRTFRDGEVVVVEPVTEGRQKRVSVLVLTDRDTQIWRPYNILLLRDKNGNASAE